MEKEVVCIIVHFLLSYLPMSSSLPYLVLRGAWLEFPHTQKEWEVVFQHTGDTHEIGTSLSLVWNHFAYKVEKSASKWLDILCNLVEQLTSLRTLHWAHASLTLRSSCKYFKYSRSQGTVFHTSLVPFLFKNSEFGSPKWSWISWIHFAGFPFCQLVFPIGRCWPIDPCHYK